MRIAKENRLWPIHVKTAPTEQESTEQESTPAISTPGIPMQRIGRLPPRNRLRHSKRAQPLWQWHQRLGHFNNADVKRLEAYNQDIKLSDGKERFCEPCTISK